MINFKEIQAVLRELSGSPGMTQQRLADASGLSQSYIAGLISGKCPVDGLTLKKINQLFPDATINLHGDNVSIHAPGNHGNVAGVNHGAIGGDWSHVALQKLLDSEELSDTEKIKVMKVLNK